ncbi:hypothetical protein [Ruminococcus bicirculans (ex Wegman et al. 2014)]|uniref:Uncharacterized protein n=1 Tax=Ruminococcus callidus ATCC 27760 TaxID=411473 RepID=U2KVC3_9FIRM|nr:hypothetical protein RUMCAL_01377 [Ruminococcus callidus ATCC 27760]
MQYKHFSGLFFSDGILFRSAGSDGCEGHFCSPEGIARASCRNNSPC